MLEWLDTFSNYIDKESKFDPLTDTIKVNWNDVDLGVIKDINDLTGEAGVKSIAKISHLRGISKMRIVQPVKAQESVLYIPPQQLKKVYDKINIRFASKGLNQKK